MALCSCHIGQSEDVPKESFWKNKCKPKRSIDFYPYFPIIVRSEFECSKLVPFISDPARLAKNLESEPVKIEIFQGKLQLKPVEKSELFLIFF